MYLGQEIKQILPGNVAVGGANMGMVPLFAVMFCPNRSAIWAGYVAADGQELSKALYPDADAGIQAGNVPAAIEATWQSTPTERGKYVATSSAGKFRLPDLNGVSVGTLGAVFLRGDGVNSSGTDGVIQPDELKSHAHRINYATGANGIIASNNVVGGSYSFGGSEATGGVETRPLNVTGCWVIKLFGSVTNAGSADAAQLATEYAGLTSRVELLEVPTRFISDPQVITAGGSLTIPHPLLVRPAAIVMNGVCLVADLGYAVDDYVYDINGTQTNLNGMTSITADETNIYVRFGSSAPSLPNKGTGAGASITLARWNVIFKAEK